MRLPIFFSSFSILENEVKKILEQKNAQNSLKSEHIDKIEKLLDMLL